MDSYSRCVILIQGDRTNETMLERLNSTAVTLCLPTWNETSIPLSGTVNPRNFHFYRSIAGSNKTPVETLAPRLSTRQQINVPNLEISLLYSSHRHAFESREKTRVRTMALSLSSTANALFVNETTRSCFDFVPCESTSSQVSRIWVTRSRRIDQGRAE